MILATLAFGAFTLAAQTPGGGITPEMLTSIRKGYGATPSEKALRNALAGTSIAVLAENAENAAEFGKEFSHCVKTKAVTDQKQSGRCWLFTGLNVLRAAAIEEHDLPAEFQFSQNYTFFWDQLEKANLFLQGIIDTRELPMEDRKVDWLFSNPLSDGGQFTGVANLITKYGVVPADVMPETFSSNNTRQMSAQIKTLLRKDGLELRGLPRKALQDRKTEMLAEVYHILALCLGVPPTEFEWKGEKWTPASFRAEYVPQDLENGYVMLMNDPCHEYGKVYEIDFDRHTYDGQNWLYINLPVETIKAIAIESIKDNTAMYFSCDVGKFMDRKRGLLDIANYDYESLFGVDFRMNKKERVATHASGSSHAMTLVAVDLKDDKPLKWMVENSWGAASGYKGKLIMTDEWFDNYMFRLVVERKFVPEDVLKMLSQKPVMLPAWDPMFMPEE